MHIAEDPEHPLSELFFGLHYGIFVVWLPAAILSLWLAKGKGSGEKFWHKVFHGGPPWVRKMASFIAGYGILTFLYLWVVDLLFLLLFTRSLMRMDIDKAAEPLFATAILTTVPRIFGGAYMLFYVSAFAVFCSVFSRRDGRERSHSESKLPGLRYPFLALAAVGFVQGLLAHVATFFGRIHPMAAMSWAPHLVFAFFWLAGIANVTRKKKHRDIRDVLLRRSPQWMKLMTGLCFGYAILAFALFAPPDWQTKMRIGEISASSIRFFSSSWMALYAFLFMTWYSAIRQVTAVEKRECPNGHRISSGALSCRECGLPIRDAEQLDRD
ncbi:MAG: hypothetical protein C4520_01245 [Candidatus Abyssobacteria bacterium SURF_5]|uniref:Uncharacterized protein n=1 Tax=Abyssobacteria bacterium (strain SURF_5) TaxID=2093360 RepID=A0A3A4PDJ5_ABYX5|nr:MAG: hypothetical protein C4520_01245 [Candidatus Abyssubacteria bacterium SURF_5]